MDCIYNESMVASNTISHIRQFKESIDGERAAMFADGQALIEVSDSERELYEVKSEQESLYIGRGLDEAIKRAKYADRRAEIIIKYQEEELTLEEYEDKTAPTLYRLTSGESGANGFLSALDIIEKGKKSKTKIFDDLIKMKEFIEKRQRDNEYYYVFSSRGKPDELDGLGLGEYDVPARHSDLTHLSDALSKERAKQRKKAGNG